MKTTQEKHGTMTPRKALKMKIKLSIESPDYWGGVNETSRHILLTIEGDQRSQRLEDWGQSWDSFGALADIIPDDETRDRVEQLIEEKTH